MIPLPDLLHTKPRFLTDRDKVFAYLELSFLGKDAGARLDDVLGEPDDGEGGFAPHLFLEDLFLEELLRTTFPVQAGGATFPINIRFLLGILARPPLDLETVEFRQEILRELVEDDDLRGKTERLYQELQQLLSTFKVPDHVARLDINAHRLEIFGQIRWVVEWMIEAFAGARSGLRRIHEAGLVIRETEDYQLMTSLLDYEDNFVNLRVDLSLNPEGRVRHLEIRRLEENSENRFYRPPWKRWLDRLRLVFWHGTKMSNREMVNRLLHQVFVKVQTPLLTLVELLGHLELYLASLGFRRLAAEHGLEVSLAELAEGQPIEIGQAFNPLLLDQRTPVPADIIRENHRGVTLLTGPNSGGKTRVLQTLGLVQILGQSGLFVPAASARLPILRGLFVSLIESETSDQAEGRLGREMMRIRSLFEGLEAPALVILDELCSGTNPSEGTELITLVLELLDRLGTVAFVSTHFLDFAQGLRDDPPIEGLELLQVEIDAEKRSTYQFIPGVAETSLAALTAERLGVTYEQLSALIDKPQG